MRWYRLAVEAIETCVYSPEAMTRSIEGRTNYWCRERGLFVRVTAIEEADGFVIITVALRRKGSGEG